VLCRQSRTWTHEQANSFYEYYIYERSRKTRIKCWKHLSSQPNLWWGGAAWRVCYRRSRSPPASLPSVYRGLGVHGKVDRIVDFSTPPFASPKHLLLIAPIALSSQCHSLMVRFLWTPSGRIILCYILGSSLQAVARLNGISLAG